MAAARIMIVEDNTTVAEDIQDSLQSLGFEITSISASGEDAVSHAGKELPDAVLMDIRLTGAMDGIAAAEKIYRDFDIPVVFLSAYSDHHLLERAKEAGSFGYLVKPFDERELLAMLQIAIYKAKTEKERRKLQGRMEEVRKMEAIGCLAGGVAHDFNNMLSVILGYTQSAMEKIEPEANAYNDLQEVLNAARRSADLVKQLLTFARKQDITPKVINLNREIARMIGFLKRLIGESIELQWIPEENLWPLNIDPSQLDQIMANLCVNARDAIGGVGTITVRTDTATVSEANSDGIDSSPGDYVVLSVSDTGHGIDKKIADKIFEPFFTTKGLNEGTGLGLATVYGIVKQNDGFIRVDSTPDTGCTFKIFLPRHVDPTFEKSDQPLQEDDILQGNETILLVEDEQAVLSMTAATLKQLGYTVLAAARPGEAIELTQTHADVIHLLLTDIIMPEMNGLELAKKILSTRPDVKCLFMSGYSADVMADHGVLESSIHFIQKPFTIAALSKQVREALGEK